ncbi:YbaB/EbfC family nucleoid-associated protein [Spirillospora sp. CA-255316]
MPTRPFPVEPASSSLTFYRSGTGPDKRFSGTVDLSRPIQEINTCDSQVITESFMFGWSTVRYIPLIERPAMFDLNPANFRIEDLERVVSQADELMKRLSESGDEMADMVGEGESKDGLLRATVDSGGRLKSIEINPRAMRQDSESLAEGLTQAIQAAQDDALSRSEGMVTELLTAYGLPTDPETGDIGEQISAVTDAAQRRFRENHDELNEVRRNIP